MKWFLSHPFLALENAEAAGGIVAGGPAPWARGLPLCRCPSSASRYSSSGWEVSAVRSHPAHPGRSLQCRSSWGLASVCSSLMGSGQLYWCPQVFAPQLTSLDNLITLFSSFSVYQYYPFKIWDDCWYSQKKNKQTNNNSNQNQTKPKKQKQKQNTSMDR